MSAIQPTPVLPWRRNLFFTTFGVVVASIAFSLLTPLLPFYLDELGLKRNVPQWAGVMIAVPALTYSVMAPIWGTLADRHGKRIMLLRSGFGIAATHMLMALSRNHVQFLLARAVNGLLGGFIPSCLMLVATNTPTPDLGFALGVIQTASPWAGLSVPLWAAWSRGCSASGTRSSSAPACWSWPP